MTKEELEKEKCELLGIIQGKDKAIADLKKENAELKEANQTLATMNENMWVKLEEKRAESQGITNKLHQLIKAKEIIKDFVDRDDSCWSIQKRAEEFLKERE